MRLAGGRWILARMPPEEQDRQQRGRQVVHLGDLVGLTKSKQSWSLESSLRTGLGATLPRLSSARGSLASCQLASQWPPFLFARVATLDALSRSWASPQKISLPPRSSRSARGDLLELSETQKPELLRGIRGAGQMLGLVTELTIITCPYSDLGTTDGQGPRICGTFIFSHHQAGLVLAALRLIVENTESIQPIHLVVTMALPHMQHQVLLVAPGIFAASADEAARMLQPLAAPQPLKQRQTPSTFFFQARQDGLQASFLVCMLHARQLGSVGYDQWMRPHPTTITNSHQPTATNI